MKIKKLVSKMYLACVEHKPKKETISTNIGKKECYKLAISSSENVLQGKNNNLLWLTADENKIIVYGKFKIPVGNGELKIKSAQGLKN